MDVEFLYSMTLAEAVKASSKDWQTPADWPTFDESKRGIWNIRIGVPERVSPGISLRPYWTPGKGGPLTDAELREHLPEAAERVLALIALAQPPAPPKKRKRDQV